MKIGTIGYRTKSGLGYQVQSYVKHLGVERILVVDLSIYNGVPLTDWYPESVTVRGYPRPPDIIKFLEGLDIVILAETPLNYMLYELARDMGVKTVVVPNWEFFDHYLKPEYALPDMIIMPTEWRSEEALRFCDEKGIKFAQIHHPVDREDFPFELRTTKKIFHIAGKPAANDRNGTFDYLSAVPDGKLLTQSDELANQVRRRYRHAKVFTNIEEPAHMYQMGDILVLPRKYGGNCLPMNEALSSGIPVIMPDISPNNKILPKEWLVKADLVSTFEPRTKVDIYQVRNDDLVAKIGWFRDSNIQAESLRADKIADTISWDKLKAKYLEAMESLLK